MFPGPLRLSSARPPFRLARHSIIQSPLGGHFTPHHGGTPGQAHGPATFGSSGPSDTSGLHPRHTEQMEIWGATFTPYFNAQPESYPMFTHRTPLQLASSQASDKGAG